MPTRRFAPLPYQVLQDDRLRAADLRVLGYLCTHDPRRQGDAFACPRQLIAHQTGMHETAVSRAIGRLVAFGWIEKLGGGHRTRKTQYRILWDQEKGNNPVTLSESEKGNNPVTLSESEKGNNPVTLSDEKGNNPVTLTPIKELEPIDRQYYRLGSTREETRAEPNNFSFVEAVKILQKHGTPDRFLFTATDRRIVMAWITDGYQASQVDSACRVALGMRKNQGDPNPIGPRYVDRILRDDNRRSSDARSSRAGSESVAERAEESNRRWLEGSGGL
ncbi:helix-turn-helix domain-containing protein [Natronospira bacteriovora]|uniref:Helix-turn-helix domain-containing protein n=1 Tax=Natronospira bacteriovora TaxID=3069753 RepID=A0ABU0W5U1_9GAMM|nr:helix-turn-helix domain-containing protein [Natronospira sp. AB-CW4]MDQ2069332.1 hypothetical protein [Natronospira sp. AB-CW4]